MWELRNVRFSDGTTVTIRIDGHTIVAIDKESRCQESVYGQGLLALPGFIDGHVHSRLMGEEHKENWATLTAAAFAGGVTTVSDQPNNKKVITTLERFEAKIIIIGESELDYRLYFGATPDNWREIERVADHSLLAGVKIFMGSSTGDLLVTEERPLRKIFEITAKKNILRTLHAEDEELMRQNRLALGRQPLISDHCLIRNTEVELAGVQRGLRLHRNIGGRTHFHHISSPETLELIRDAKDHCEGITVEVCPHHWWLDASWLDRPDGGKFKMNPGLRSLEQARKMRVYVGREDMVDIVASDHAPHTLAEKQLIDYDNVPSGVTGVQTLGLLTFQLVWEKKLSLERFVALTATNPAKLFGLNKKGKLLPGFDADIVLLHPNEYWLIRDVDIRSKCGWTPYHGTGLIGRIKLVVARGKVVLNQLTNFTNA